MKRRTLSFCLLLHAFCSASQVCTHPGQTPVSAVLICGTEALQVTTPAFCGQFEWPAPCNDGFIYRDVNPNFFRMACFESGTLGFSILPDEITADYNWALFDITSTNPSDIFTNRNLLVACNWSGLTGETGASDDGSEWIVCSGNQPLFSKMPEIRRGHTYLLMICNQSFSTRGYQLTFTGGTAVITDASTPRILFARPDCNGREVVIRFSKKIHCATVAANGSDFRIVNGPEVVSATAVNCSEMNGTDSIRIRLDSQLSNGFYTLTIQKGTDDNTLTDICGITVPENHSSGFMVNALQPAVMDSLFWQGCSPEKIQLFFSKPILCRSLSPDGSEFIFLGPHPVPFRLSAQTLHQCQNQEFISSVTLEILSPWKEGTYRLRLKKGSDGNTVSDECGLFTPESQEKSFSIQHPVSARFTYQISNACKERMVKFFHDGNGGAISWKWNFGNQHFSHQQNPAHLFQKPGTYTIQLIVSNGKCADTSEQTLMIPPFLKASFESPALICPEDTVYLKNTTVGAADEWLWDFGNGKTERSRQPSSYQYDVTGRKQFYTVTLIAKNNSWSCGDTVRKVIQVLPHCRIEVPGAFSPNGDGKNDFLYPVGALHAENLEFRIYNRAGQMIFHSASRDDMWDGTYLGVAQPSGIYIWTLSYIQKDTGKRIFRKGTTMLIR